MKWVSQKRRRRGCGGRLLLARGGLELGHGLGALGDGVLGELYLLANGALLAPCRRWIGKCKCPRPQNEQHQLVLRLIVTRILSACAARRFFGNTNPCSMEIAQLAFGKTPLRRPQTLRGRAKTQPPGAGCPRDVRDELRSKSGVSATEY